MINMRAKNVIGFKQASYRTWEDRIDIAFIIGITLLLVLLTISLITAFAVPESKRVEAVEVVAKNKVYKTIYYSQDVEFDAKNQAKGHVPSSDCIYPNASSADHQLMCHS